MARGDERRKSHRGIEPGAASSMEGQRGDRRLGARRERPLATRGGGGYPDSCTILKLRPDAPGRGDPRVDELRTMGLPRLWLDVAELIGVDNFLAMWRRLDQDFLEAEPEDEQILVKLRPYRSYLRFQRNRYIETLVEAGHDVQSVCEAVEKMLGEKVSKRHISRIARGK